MRDSMQVKIGDFGLACLDLLSTDLERSDSFSSSRSSCTSNKTQHNDSCTQKDQMHTKGVGTMTYASPEQKSGEKYDTKVFFLLKFIFIFFKIPLNYLIELNIK